MTALVTGAGGHLGGTLVRTLLAAGRRVRVLIRGDAPALDGLEVERVTGDLCDPAAIAAALAGATVVFHAAARISLSSREDPELRRVNVGGTALLVDACLAAGTPRLVHVSSVHALDLRGAAAIDDRLPLATHRRALPYDRSKAGAEREVLRGVAAGLDAVIVSPPAVIGPYDFKPSQIGRLLRDLRAAKLPALSGGAQVWVDVRDVAAAVIAGATSGRRGERYLLGGHPRTVVELAELAAAEAGVRRPRIVVPLPLLRAIAPAAETLSRWRRREPVLTPVSVAALTGPQTIRDAKARDHLGFAPRPLAQTIRETMAWLAGELDEPAAPAPTNTPHVDPPRV